MKFTIISDLHGEIGFMENQEVQKDTILLIPGDIHEARRTGQYREILSVLTSKFVQVVMVAGNHEYYGSNFNKTHRVLKAFEHEFSNFHFLNDEFRIFGDVLVLGGTLWTDYDNSNPITKLQAQLGMNDYKYIRTGPPEQYWQRKVSPDDLEFLHYKTKTFLQKCLDNQREVCDNLKTVVMTHHAPSFGSVDPYFKDDNLNGCYCSNMEGFIESLGVDLWIHGHVHSSHDYMIGSTQVLCNPHGYMLSNGTPENKNFNSTLTVEV